MGQKMKKLNLEKVLESNNDQKIIKCKKYF